MLRISWTSKTHNSQTQLLIHFTTQASRPRSLRSILTERRKNKLNSREWGEWVAQFEAVKVLPLPLSLSPAFGVCLASWILSQRPPSVPVKLPAVYVDIGPRTSPWPQAIFHLSSIIYLGYLWWLEILRFAQTFPSRSIFPLISPLLVLKSDYTKPFWYNLDSHRAFHAEGAWDAICEIL